MLMNDKIIFDRYYCINSGETKEIMRTILYSYIIRAKAFIFLVKVTEWPPIGNIAAHSAYDMFHGINT